MPIPAPMMARPAPMPAPRNASARADSIASSPSQPASSDEAGLRDPLLGGVVTSHLTTSVGHLTAGSSAAEPTAPRPIPFHLGPPSPQPRPRSGAQSGLPLPSAARQLVSGAVVVRVAALGLMP